MVTDSSKLTKIKISKVQMNLNAVRFKTNIEEEIKAENSSIKSGARYECIYKNLLRDIRQFYSHKFDMFLQEQFGLSRQKKNMDWKQVLFPYHVLQFTS